jgi:hypothetical protein
MHAEAFWAKVDKSDETLEDARAAVGRHQKQTATEG